jgi:hypothetical protein
MPSPALASSVRLNCIARSPSSSFTPRTLDSTTTRMLSPSSSVTR